MFHVIEQETIQTISLSLAIICLSVFVVTVDVQVTLLVLFSVLLVDLFTLAMAYYTDLTFNPFVAVNLNFALGMTVDYSAHIAHTYLRVATPDSLAPRE